VNARGNSVRKYRPWVAVALVSAMHRLVDPSIAGYEAGEVRRLMDGRRSQEAAGSFFLTSLSFAGFLACLVVVPAGIALAALTGSGPAAFAACVVAASGAAWALAGLLLRGTLSMSDRAYEADWRVLTADVTGLVFAVLLGALLFVVTSP
jgi:hypothetical protein